VLAGAAAAQFGIGGHAQVALGADDGVPVIPVGHDGGEHGLALRAGPHAGQVAAGQFVLPGGGVVLAAAVAALASALARRAARRALRAAARIWRSSSPQPT